MAYLQVAVLRPEVDENGVATGLWTKWRHQGSGDYRDQAGCTFEGTAKDLEELGFTTVSPSREVWTRVIGGTLRLEPTWTW